MDFITFAFNNEYHYNHETIPISFSNVNHHIVGLHFLWTFHPPFS